MSYPAFAGGDNLAVVFPTMARIYREERRLWRGLTGSILGHLLIIGACFAPALAVDRGESPTPPRRVTEVFAPPPAAQPPVPISPAMTATATEALEPPHIEAPPIPDAPVNLSAIRFTVADDVRGQLPDVVQAQGGMLALLDRENRSIASYVFQPPDWQPVETTKDVSRMMRIEMYPPEVWAVFRNAAESHGIALDHYLAVALFDMRYRSCLQNAIRRSASGAQVSAVLLKVAPDSPCGFQMEVTLAASPNR